MRRNPQFRGQAIFACHVNDLDYWQSIRAAIPGDLQERFTLLAANAAREALLSGNVVVIPSEYESLCLAAYEAAAAGATLVLNRDCPAFGADTPFGAADSCHGFAKSATSLAEALEAAVRNPNTRGPVWEASIPYWTEPQRPRFEAVRREAKVSVVITNYNLGRHLPEAIASVANSSHLDVEIVLVDDCSTSAFDRELLDSLPRDEHLKVIRNPANLGLAASRNLGVAAASGDYVLPLDADDVIGSRFISMAVDALERHPEFGGVVPQTAYFDSDEELAARRFPDYAMFLGDVPSMGLVENRLSSATALLRRSLVTRFGYDEKLSAYEDWNLYLRMTHAGVRFLTTNDLSFFYRRRRGSMISGVDSRRRLELMMHTIDTLPRPFPPSVRPLSLLLPALQMASAPVVAAPAEPALRHKIVDRIDENLKRLPYLQPALRRITLDIGRLVGNRLKPSSS